MEKLDVEYLQKLAYDRSRIWSSFFENYENDPTIARLGDIAAEVDVTKIEKYFDPADDDSLSDNLASMEDDYDDNVNTEFLKNATNTSQFSMLLGNTAVDITLMAKSEDEKQYVDMINKTLPILHEHKRQLKELGFDKVLTSFKRHEIEDKFGSWLNRHNSLFGGDNTFLYAGKNKEHKTGNDVVAYYKPTRDKTFSIQDKQTDSDSDGSLQSGETARYIRSSKVGAAKNFATTMIKTYRMVSSTRQALREKYACESDEDDYHRNTVRSCKKLGRMECPNHYMTPVGRSNKNQRLAFTTRTGRRKVLRKRINSHSCNGNSSSSDTEHYENYQKAVQCKNLLRSCCNRCTCCPASCYKTPLNRNNKIFRSRTTTKLTTALRNRMRYFSHSMSLSSSTSSTSFEGTEKRRNIKRKAKYNTDARPHKRESECYCINDKELCTKYKHVAETSTEEWFVDNECTPKIQMLKSSESKTETKSSQQSKLCQKVVLRPATEAKRSHQTGKKNNNLKENKYKSDTFIIEDSDADLKMAIEVSKEAFKEEQKKKLKRDAAVAEKDDKSKPMKITRKLSTIEENVPEKPAIKTKRISQKTEAKSTTTTKSNEETFFAPNSNQAICNSTALSTRSHAYKRQFSDSEPLAANNASATTIDNTIMDLTRNKPKPKSVAKKLAAKENGRMKNGATSSSVTSTTIRSPDLLLSTIAESKDDCEKTGDDQSDCAHVTSTTNIGMSVSKAAKTKDTKEPPQSNSNRGTPQNWILVYDPEKRNMVPANCFTSDGYFTITQEHLSTFIGDRAARKFLTCYIGRKYFRLDAKVYYKPPNNSTLRQSLVSSSGSSDELEYLGLYGDLVSVATK